jgi:hypothetical protein
MHLQKNSFLVDMIEIEPLELHFSAELNKQVSHMIKLTNYADDYIAFRVSATSRLPFHMVPNKDVIPPRSSCSVTISLEALKKRLGEQHYKAELSVQSARVDEVLTSQDITVDIFKEEPDKVVDTVNLTVSYIFPPSHVEGRFKLFSCTHTYRERDLRYSVPEPALRMQRGC